MESGSEGSCERGFFCMWKNGVFDFCTCRSSQQFSQQGCSRFGKCVSELASDETSRARDTM